MRPGLQTALKRLYHMRKRAWLLLIIITLGVLLAWFDLRDTHTVSPDPAARADEPGHVADHATLALYDDSGQLTQQLTSPRITHTPQQSMTRLDTPHATLIDSEQNEWHASANEGTLDGEQQQLMLSGDAHLVAPNEGWQLDTQVLYYDSQTAHAWSDSPALLQQPPQRIRAQRLDAWLDTGKVRLTDRVRGHHPPVAASAEETP
ncbi:MAG: LPS export ABC transporter periplasmic protein LptC [Halomonas subglaciescola]|nr:LPS export ABC transporter periplasmic protein LptC [Halomonas subglaciescola]